MSAKRTRTVAVVLVAALATAVVACKLTGVEAVKGTGGGVSGSVYAEAEKKVGAPGVSEQVFLPDIEVSLFRPSDGATTATTTTDFFGRYAFPRQESGTYELRWKAQLGWAAGQHPDAIVIASENQGPTPARILPELRTGVLFGRVSFADGSTPWNSAELFGVDNSAEVTVLDIGRTDTLAGPIHANAVGFFAAAGLPLGANLTVRAKHEAVTVSQAVASGVVSFGGTAAMAAVGLANHRPEIHDLVPAVNGAVVQTAAPGDEISVSAVTRDVDGDPLTRSWRVLPGHGTLTPAGDTALWRLPDHVGRYSAYLLVADGRGGYAQQRIDFATAQTHVTFAGRAVDKSTELPVASADVSVNGERASTAANGHFAVRVPIASRYVMNIEKLGYALFSRVVDAPLTGQTWRLVRTQVQQVDPQQPISIADTRPELDRQKLKGMKVRIPANALVDASGKPPTGMLTAHMATLNIADGDAPGDWGGLSGGQETNLISYGAGFVEFVDGAGTRFNLAAGSTAEVEFVAPPSMLAGAPATTPTWSYDTKTGYWMENGSSVFVAATGSYVNKVEHFSTINTDLEKEDAACLGVMIYPPIPTGVRLRVSSADFDQAFDFVLDAGMNAVYRLPANTDVTLELLAADGSAYGATVLLEEVPGTPLPGNVVNTGPALPAGTTLWPPEPYVPPCKLVILREANEPTANAFLAFMGKGSEAEAEAYYAAVDPNDTRETLREWWETNEFEFADANGNGVLDDPDFLEPPTNAIRTSYLNYNDLGSGRDMYFLRRADGSVAAYVTNYGQFNQDHENADLAADRDTPGATVCMEWSAVEGQGSTRIVKFFVYAGNDFGPNAARQVAANLDGFEEKFVPNLCQNCHGGSRFSTASTTASFAEVNLGASFRELDTATYLYPDGELVPNAAQKSAFKDQNLIVRGANGESVSVQAIKDLVDGWYLAGTDDQDNEYVPPGFTAATESLYLDLVRNSCRTCHVALGSSINWTSYAQLESYHGFLKSFALCESRYMPHAVIAYRNYWLSASPHRPASLREFENLPGWEKLGPCD